MSTPASVTRTAASLLRTRWLVRAPVRLYKARLGILFGPRFVMIEHTGRKSGARRYAVLEVVGRPSPGSYLVVSGFGQRAQWFRNIRADPRVRVYALSRPPANGTARVLPRPEAAAALAAYVARHPRAWEAARPVLRDTLGGPDDDIESRLPVVALELGRREPGRREPGR
ncbi:MAG: nitroreductase family deazaflavin-dependent oxidoreductase [Nocardiopsaceae bacterium]|nr:nitroreductase family deazaflavin-dependent oxidoreductase [Nocardiopsaceae bacterium]